MISPSVMSSTASSFSDYDRLRESLLWTLEQALGKDFRPSVREAWTVCYDELAGEMKAALGV